MKTAKQRRFRPERLFRTLDPLSERAAAAAEMMRFQAKQVEAGAGRGVNLKSTIEAGRM